MSAPQDLGLGEDGDELEATLGESLASTSFAVHEAGDEIDDAAFGFDGFDGLQRGFPARDDVIDDDDVVALLEVALDAAALAVVLGLFADAEDLEPGIAVGIPRSDAHGHSHGVRAHGEATHGDRGFPTERGADFRVEDATEEHSGFGVHGGDAAIHVDAALCAGSQREVAVENGVAFEKFQKP